MATYRDKARAAIAAFASPGSEWGDLQSPPSRSAPARSGGAAPLAGVGGGGGDSSLVSSGSQDMVDDMVEAALAAAGAVIAGGGLDDASHWDGEGDEGEEGEEGVREAEGRTSGGEGGGVSSEVSAVGSRRPSQEGLLGEAAVQPPAATRLPSLAGQSTLHAAAAAVPAMLAPTAAAVDDSDILPHEAARPAAVPSSTFTSTAYRAAPPAPVYGGGHGVGRAVPRPYAVSPPPAVAVAGAQARGEAMPAGPALDALSSSYLVRPGEVPPPPGALHSATRGRTAVASPGNPRGVAAAVQRSPAAATLPVPVWVSPDRVAGATDVMLDSARQAAAGLMSRVADLQRRIATAPATSVRATPPPPAARGWRASRHSPLPTPPPPLAAVPVPAVASPPPPSVAAAYRVAARTAAAVLAAPPASPPGRWPPRPATATVASPSPILSPAAAAAVAGGMLPGSAAAVHAAAAARAATDASVAPALREYDALVEARKARQEVSVSALLSADALAALAVPRVSHAAGRPPSPTRLPAAAAALAHHDEARVVAMTARAAAAAQRAAALRAAPPPPSLPSHAYLVDGGGLDHSSPPSPPSPPHHVAPTVPVTPADGFLPSFTPGAAPWLPPPLPPAVPRSAAAHSVPIAAAARLASPPLMPPPPPGYAHRASHGSTAAGVSEPPVAVVDSPLVAQLCRLMHVPLAAAATDLAPAVAAAAVEASHAAALQAVVLQLSGAAAGSPVHRRSSGPTPTPLYLAPGPSTGGVLYASSTPPPRYTAARAATAAGHDCATTGASDLMRAAYDQVRASSALLARVGPFH